MAVAANKRSVMTLFSGANDMFSHQVRIVLAEKGVSVDICQVDPANLPDELAELNPYNTVPTLVDRELALYTSRIIMEYLDERFPHPPLMPVYPVARGNSRLMMHRIELDWYSLADKIMAGTDTEAARAELRDNLLAIAPHLRRDALFRERRVRSGRLLHGAVAVASTEPGHRFHRPWRQRAEGLHGSPVRA